MRRWLLAGLVVGLVVCALAWRVAAGGGERHSYSGALTLLDGVVPAREGTALPPGTPIGAGLHVAQGSYLLGGPLPYLYSELHGGEPIEDEGFEAHLLATEPIREVVERYRSQAVDAGFEMAPATCLGSGDDLVCRTTCEAECGFGLSGNSTGYEHGRTLTVSGQQQAESPSVSQAGPSTPVSYVFIEHRVLGEPPYPTAEFHRQGDAPTERGSVPLDWPPLPTVGDPIVSFNDFEVAPGTILLAHGLGSYNSEATAVFEVVDDLDSVIESFTRQPRRRAHDVTRETFRRDGERIDRVNWADGHGQSLVFHELEDGPTILVLSSTVAD